MLSSDTLERVIQQACLSFCSRLLRRKQKNVRLKLRKSGRPLLLAPGASDLKITPLLLKYFRL